MKSDTMKTKIEEYFSSVSSTSRRMMVDLKSSLDHCQKRETDWSNMSYTQQQSLLYNELVTSKVKDKYNYYPYPESELPSFPKLIISSGEKMVVDPENEDSSNSKGSGRSLQGISWRDEHSAPFCWETRSQLEMSLNNDGSEATKNYRNSQTNYEGVVLENWKFQFSSQQEAEVIPNDVLKELGLNEEKNIYQNIEWTLPDEDNVEEEVKSKEVLVMEEKESLELEIQPQIDDEDDRFIPKTGFDFLDNW